MEAAAGSSRAAGFSSDKCTSEWQNHKREIEREKYKQKICTSQRCCIYVIFWYTETDAEKEGDR